MRFLIVILFIILFVILAIVFLAGHWFITHFILRMIYEIGGEGLIALVCIASLILFYVLKKRKARQDSLWTREVEKSMGRLDEMDIITRKCKCNGCGQSIVMSKVSEAKCPYCGSRIAASKKRTSKSIMDILIGLGFVAAVLAQRVIYKIGGEDLAGIIGILGVAILVYLIILRRRERKANSP